MRVAAFVIGLIGGVLGLIIGWAAYASGTSRQVEFYAVILAVLGIVAAGTAMVGRKGSAPLMALAGICIIVVLPGSEFIPGALLLISALFAYLARDRDTKPI